LGNIEELVFYDSRLRKKLPDLVHLFNQWELAKRVSALRPMGKRALVDFMNQVTDEQMDVIEKHLGTKVIFDKIDYHIVKNYDFTLEEAEVKINEVDTFSNAVVHRDGDHLYISFWR
jgi:hypothetical protein